MSQAGRWSAMAAAGLLLLAGCADQPASAAATVGQERIEMSDISAQLDSINEVLGLPAGSAAVDQTNAVLRNNVVYRLVEQAAADAGVAVTPTQVQRRMADQVAFVGDSRLLEQQAAQAGIGPELIEDDVRVSLLAQALAEDLAEGQSLTDQDKQTLLIEQVQQYSNDAGTTINPRFGWWDVRSLSIVADPEAPSARPADLGLIGSPDGP